MRLTLRITCRRKRAKPAVAGQVHAVVGRQASQVAVVHFCVLEYAMARATRLSARFANVNSPHGSENAPLRPASLGDRIRHAASYRRSRTIFVRRISYRLAYEASRNSLNTGKWGSATDTGRVEPVASSKSIR